MNLARKFLTLSAPLALLGLSACATGLPTQVSRFQAMPAPEGQTFAIQAANPRNQGGLEFSQYAELVRQHLTSLGYVQAPSAQSASFVVELDYGVDEGKQKVVTYPGTGFGYRGLGYRGWGWGGFYRPHFSRFGYFGRGYSPFYWGWDDPFYDPWDYPEVRSYTEYTSFLDMDIKRTADGQSLFEGTAKARSRTDDLQVLVPNLVEAMFVGFPGRSGETVKITVPTPPRDRR